MEGKVVVVSLSQSHSFSKPNQESIKLLTGFGVVATKYWYSKIIERK